MTWAIKSGCLDLELEVINEKIKYKNIYSGKDIGNYSAGEDVERRLVIGRNENCYNLFFFFNIFIGV